jgi:hypothetical protein
VEAQIGKALVGPSDSDEFIRDMEGIWGINWGVNLFVTFEDPWDTNRVSQCSMYRVYRGNGSARLFIGLCRAYGMLGSRNGSGGKRSL